MDLDGINTTDLVDWGEVAPLTCREADPISVPHTSLQPQVSLQLPKLTRPHLCPQGLPLAIVAHWSYAEGWKNLEST